MTSDDHASGHALTLLRMHDALTISATFNSDLIEASSILNSYFMQPKQILPARTHVLKTFSKLIELLPEADKPKVHILPILYN